MTTRHDPEIYSLNGVRSGLGALLMLEIFNRLRCGICGSNKLPGRAFTDAVWIDAGYELDAPDSMPAGGMTSILLPGDPDALPEQMLCDR